MSKKLVEVARSFSMKKNLGNYESVDFFASQKAEVPEEEAEKTSEALYEFCKAECIKSLNEYLKGLQQPNDSEFGNLPKTKKEFVKPWEKQMRKTMAEAESEFEAMGPHPVHDSNAPVYKASDRDGGKVLVNKEENTISPF